MKSVKICDATLRDGQQSLIATRMRIEEIQPILAKMDEAGFYSMEVWGGATFDSCLRYLKEDPWDRLRKIRSSVKNTKLQMLLRGQNILGYKNYSDDVVEMFVRKSIENGIDILRIFDALNDVRNLETAVKATKKENAHAQLAISYTLSDVHTLEYYVQLGKRLEDIGADSICIKDMAGLLLPMPAYELVKALKENVSVPIEVHSHYTSGVASMTYLKAIEAGADIIDTDMSPFSMGTAQPSTEVMVGALKDTEYDTKLEQSKLKEITDYFKPLREEALKSGLLNTKMLAVDINTLLYQVPGGMLSNLLSQLKSQNAEDRYEEVLKEIPKVRADLGYPPLVTPSSQIVGTQAVLNVLMGERYKMVPKETKDIVRGMYGKTPVPISEEIRKKIIGDEEPITCRPADLLEPVLEKTEKEMSDYKEQEEDVLSYTLFPQVAMEFFKFRQAQKYGIDPSLADITKKVYPV
ncbi:MAG: oxaloacetate decarboxylase subunit alpha [Firmicutes bacterium]|nr:oxaloacetate decarboxylase subunit alpha [Bacillota bacterium]